MIYFIRNTQYLGWVSLQRYRNNCSLDDNRVSAQRARLKTELNLEMCDSMDFFPDFLRLKTLLASDYVGPSSNSFDCLWLAFAN